MGAKKKPKKDEATGLTVVNQAVQSVLEQDAEMENEESETLTDLELPSLAKNSATKVQKEKDLKEREAQEKERRKKAKEDAKAKEKKKLEAVPPPLPEPSLPPLDLEMGDEEPTDPAIDIGTGTGSQTISQTLTQPTIRPATTAIDITKLAPLDKLLDDPDITEIMINDENTVLVERPNGIIDTGIKFHSLADLELLVENILKFTGKSLDPENPYLDVVLDDGSRVHIVAPPITPRAPSITVRKFPKRYTMDELEQLKCLSDEMAYFMNIAVVGKLNILISGGTGSGKTTLLNAMAKYIPRTERVITIEDTPEINLEHKNVVRMLTKMQSSKHKAVTQRDLIKNAMRMRPDRLIVGEIRESEALDILQSMNTGHEGSLSTIHANSPREALTRLETLCLMSGLDLPLHAIRGQISAAIDLVIHIKRFRNGLRRISEVLEVTGTEGDTLTTQPLFQYQIREDATFVGEEGSFLKTGIVPRFLDKLQGRGLGFPADFFYVDGDADSNT